MRKAKPIRMVVSKLFVEELDVYLKENEPDFKYDMIYLYSIIQTISFRLLKKKLKDKEPDYVDLKIAYLKKITVWNISKYIQILVDRGFIEKKDSFENGFKSVLYKINAKYLSSSYTKVEIPTDSKLHKKIIYGIKKKRSHDHRMDPYIQQMKKEFMQLDMDYEGAEKWIDDHVESKKKLSYYNTLLHFEDKRFRYFKRNTTNQRLDSNLTGLKSELKQFLIGDYIQIDLANSQPFLLSQLLKSISGIHTYRKGSKINIKYLIKVFGIRVFRKISILHQNLKKEDLAAIMLFDYSVISGRFYESFEGLSKVSKTRKELKNMMFGVFYSQNISEYNGRKRIPYKREKDFFESVYPFVSQTVYHLKEKNYKRLSIYLQQLESYIFIDCIAKELVEVGVNFLTIHDAVLVKKEQADVTLRLIKEVFMNNFGVVPTFHVTPL